MTTADKNTTDPMKAVIFHEGTNFRAVATWRADKEIHSIELERRGQDALGIERWEDCGFVVQNNALHYTSDTGRWLTDVLIERAIRWLRENT